MRPRLTGRIGGFDGTPALKFRCQLGTSLVPAEALVPRSGITGKPPGRPLFVERSGAPSPAP